MKFKKKTLASVALAAVFACGALSGCAEFLTTNSLRDMEQVIATVDISAHEDFEQGGTYAKYADLIEREDIYKRDMLAQYANYGYIYVNSYGYSYADTFELIKDSLVNRQALLQYAKIYFFENDPAYTVEGYRAAVDGAAESEKEIAGLEYFLTEKEHAQADYDLKAMFNSTIDAQEAVILGLDDHDHSDSSGDRATPTGVNTEEEEYYNPAYRIYTATGVKTDYSSPSASDCVAYELQEGSTPTTRKDAYNAFLGSLKTYGLITAGEDTTKIESLNYFLLEKKSQYQTALINKLIDAFEKEAEGKIGQDWLEESKISATLESQKEEFDKDKSAFEEALDSVSDSSFLLYAPDEGYGFVINILLPFSTRQSDALSRAPADLNDSKGNKFNTRANLLRGVRATDQRATWFTGATDYSFLAEADDGAYTAGQEDRTYLFFEDSIRNTDERYEALKNYYGKYTYNGKVVKTEEEKHGDHTHEAEYSFTPNRISIDDFIEEMRNYLSFAGLTLEDQNEGILTGDAYYAPRNYYDDEDPSKVDYSKFLYYKGKVDFDFDANRVFDPTSDVNKAMSVINELSFAYNTDTAGLNTYLGYAISPYETNFVKEFEYAAQEAVRGGAGTITVAPSDYGWHIMYCTFSYAGNKTPYTFNYGDIEKEGTFSNLYYEALKSQAISSYASGRQTAQINKYVVNDACVTVYEDRYANLSNLGV